MPLTKKELENLPNSTHSFTLYNFVHNEKSTSTPIRLVSNTSTLIPASMTSLSIQQLRPEKTLNNMHGSIIRFRLFPIPICGDIKRNWK